MSQIVATKKSDEITLPRSTTGIVMGISTVPTVINLKAIGTNVFDTTTSGGSDPGLQNTFASLFADGVDLGYLSGARVGDVTGTVVTIAVTAAGSGYTSAPTVSFTASTLMGGVTVTGGGSGYTVPPIVAFSGGGGSGAMAVALINSAGAVTGVNIGALGAGYTSAGTVSFTSANGLGSGAAGTPTLATASATATISAGAVTAITVVTTGLMGGAGYGSAGAAVVTISGGGGSGATATATCQLNAPSLTATGIGNGNNGGAPGICPRLPSGQGRDMFTRDGHDVWLGVVGSSSGGTVRCFRSST